MIVETCTKMIENNTTLREQVLTEFTNFAQQAESRTADVV